MKYKATVRYTRDESILTNECITYDNSDTTYHNLKRDFESMLGYSVIDITFEVEHRHLYMILGTNTLSVADKKPRGLIVNYDNNGRVIAQAFSIYKLIWLSFDEIREINSNLPIEIVTPHKNGTHFTAERYTQVITLPVSTPYIFHYLTLDKLMSNATQKTSL